MIDIRQLSVGFEQQLVLRGIDLHLDLFCRSGTDNRARVPEPKRSVVQPHGG